MKRLNVSKLLSRRGGTYTEIGLVAQKKPWFIRDWKEIVGTSVFLILLLVLTAIW